MFKVRGDLIALFKAGRYDVIVHGQNCHCDWRDGIAKSIAYAFPEAVGADLQTKPGDASKLGTYTHAVLPQGVIINAYTQYDFYGVGPQGGPLAQYAAIREVFRRLRVEFGGQGKRFAVPAIGAARAGGDWNVISAIIDQELAGENVTFVEFDGVDAERGDYRRNMAQAINAPISNKLLSTTLPSIEDAGAAVAEALGEAYDCHRVWHAWGVGTMTQDDFSLVGDDPERVVEIAGAVLDLCREPFELLQAQVARLEAQVKTLQSDSNSYQSGYDHGRAMGSKFAHHERGRLVNALDELEREHRALLAGQAAAQAGGGQAA